MSQPAVLPPVHTTSRAEPRAAAGPIGLRSAAPDEAPALLSLIERNLAEGHLLPRTLSELTVHATRFVVATEGDRVVGCAELAPLSHTVAEVRSLAVDPGARGIGMGRLIVDELRRRARIDGFRKLCAFTHRPAYFVHMGFSIVPHIWLSEKIFTDCVGCAQFRVCGQYAMLVRIEPSWEAGSTPAAGQA